MSPPIPCSIIAPAAARETRKEPLAITSCCRSQSASVVSSSGLEIDRPALLTTRSTPPKASAAASMAFRTAAGSVTSACTPTALSVVPIPLAVATAEAGSTSTTTTQAPSAARRSAIALPMPEPPPVTNAIRPARGLGAGSRDSLASSSAQYSLRNFSASSIGA